MTVNDNVADDFTRLHKLFTFHLGIAVGLTWMTALYAAFHVPWVRNIRPLLDPSNADRIESTWSFLFGLPIVLTVAWVMVFAGRDMLRHFAVLKNQSIEFGFAGAAAFVVFYMAIDRAVTAMLIGF